MTVIGGQIADVIFLGLAVNYINLDDSLTTATYARAQFTWNDH